MATDSKRRCNGLASRRDGRFEAFPDCVRLRIKHFLWCPEFWRLRYSDVVRALPGRVLLSTWTRKWCSVTFSVAPHPNWNANALTSHTVCIMVDYEKVNAHWPGSRRASGSRRQEAFYMVTQQRPNHHDLGA